MKRILYILLAVIISMQAFAQNKVSYEYDALNQLTKVTYSNGTVVVYTYDALGNRLSKKVTSTASLKEYTITLTASPAEGGTVSGAGTYTEGTSVTIKAVPADGYEFSNWSDDNINSTRSITVSKNLSLTAYFTKKSDSSVTGDVNGDGTVDDNDVTQVKRAYLGYIAKQDAYDLDKDGDVTVADVAIAIAIKNGTYSGGGDTPTPDPDPDPDPEPVPTTGDYNGHAWVDLGLPSGTLWATCNVDASAPEGIGTYFAWGETSGKTEYQPKNHVYYNSSTSEYTKYFVETDEEACHGIVDGKTQLEPEDDAATVNWGAEWRMPTYTEIVELEKTKYTTWTLTSVNGMAGYVVESVVEGYEGNSIFIPLSGYFHGTTNDRIGTHGYYWTSTLDTSYPNNAKQMCVTESSVTKGGNSRHVGLQVRPVVSKTNIK